jgi:hypothetical protein
MFADPASKLGRRALQGWRPGPPGLAAGLLSLAPRAGHTLPTDRPRVMDRASNVATRRHFAGVGFVADRVGPDAIDADAADEAPRRVRLGRHLDDRGCERVLSEDQEDDQEV